jgi:membrane protein required for colicin V production
MTLTSVDIIIVAVLALSGLIGAWRGLVKEVLSIAGWIAASLAMVYGFEPLQPVLRDFIESQALADIITGILLFAGSLIVVSIITHRISKWVKNSAFGSADRGMGFLFGLLRGGLIVIAVFFLFAATLGDKNDYPDELAQAQSLPYLQTSTRYIMDMVQHRRLPDGLDSLPKDATSDDETGIEPPGP